MVRVILRSIILLLLVASIVIVVLANRNEQSVHEFLSGKLFSETETGTGAEALWNTARRELKVEDVGKDIDEQMLQGEISQNDQGVLLLGSGGWDTEELSAGEFESLYQEAIATDDTYIKTRIAEVLYTQFNKQEALPILVHLLMTVREFDKALEYVQHAEKETNIVETFWADRIIYLMFNSLELHFKNYNRVKSVISTYLADGHIDEDDHDLYFGLIALSKGDIENYRYYIDRIKDGKYTDRNLRLQQRIQETQQYGDVPSYYLLWLLWIDAYAQGRYQVAQLVAKKVIQEDANYLLGYQLLAYSDLMLGRRDEAAETLRYLQANEPDHVQLYLLLEAIALFEMQQYADSIYLLRQIAEPLLLADAKRYLFLAYSAIDDRAAMKTSIDEMSQQSLLVVHDYFTVFDEFLYQLIRDPNQAQLSKEEVDTLTTFLARCYKELQQNHSYVCLYGKAWMLYAQGQTEKAKNYLERLVQWYPRWVVYERLGDLAASEKKYDDAKKRYFEALHVTSNDDELYEQMRSKVLSTSMKTR